MSKGKTHLLKIAVMLILANLNLFAQQVSAIAPD